MNNMKSRSAFYCGIALLLCVISINGFAGGKTTRVSVGLGGANPNGESSLRASNAATRAISANGRFVAFHSSASNLVTGDTNNVEDIFVYDRLTNKTTRVNVASNGDQALVNSSKFNCLGCSGLSISSDGRFVAFASVANNLVVGDTNSASDIFVHDRLTKQTTRVNVNSKGEQATGQLFLGSLSPAISSDGRYVAFQSDANNLVTGDTNATTDVFVHDRLTKKTTRISVSSTGQQAIGGSENPSISADGRYVTFDSFADNLVAGDTNSGLDIFVHDLQTNQTTRVNVNSKGEQAFDTTNFDIPGTKISADGRYVAFHSFAENLVPDDTNGGLDVFVRDLKTHQTTRVSVDSNNAQGNGYGWFLHPDISADGRFVVFISDTISLAANDKNDLTDVYLHDRWAHQTSVVSVDVNGFQAGGTGIDVAPSINADGRYVAFDVLVAPNFVAGDTSLGQAVLVRDRKLITTNPTDLQITATQKPSTLARNSQGSYTYTIANNGPNPAYTTITHLVSNGEVVGFTPAKGKCNSYASISICNLDLLQPGASVTLDVSVKALRTPVSQQLTLASGGRDDPNKANNYLTVNTPVTP